MKTDNEIKFLKNWMGSSFFQFWFKVAKWNYLLQNKESASDVRCPKMIDLFPGVFVIENRKYCLNLRKVVIIKRKEKNGYLSVGFVDVNQNKR